jgi:hypothetical protein
MSQLHLTKWLKCDILRGQSGIPLWCGLALKDEVKRTLTSEYVNNLVRFGGKESHERIQ